MHLIFVATSSPEFIAVYSLHEPPTAVVPSGRNIGTHTKHCVRALAFLRTTMLSRCSSMLSMCSLALLLSFSSLLVGVAHAAVDDKTKLGNDTIDRVSIFLLYSNL